MSDYDAILVGAGHNSLACAAHLARKGWKVAVFERNPAIGGAVQTQRMTLPGFRHDLGAMNLSLFAGSAFHRTYANELKAGGLDFAPVADCFATAFPDGRWFGVSTDIEKTVARLAAFSPADAATWRRLVAEFPGEAEHLFRLLGSPMTGRALAGTAWNDLAQEGRARRAADAAAAARPHPAPGSTRPSSRRMSRRRSPPGACISTSRPTSPGGAVFPYLESMANQSFGMVLGKGGADTMIRALEHMVTDRPAASIVTDADVAEITTSRRHGHRHPAGVTARRTRRRRP